MCPNVTRGRPRSASPQPIAKADCRASSRNGELVHVCYLRLVMHRQSDTQNNDDVLEAALGTVLVAFGSRIHPTKIRSARLQQSPFA